MKDGKINTNKLKISKFVYLTVFFLFILFSVSLGYRCLADYKVKDIMFSEFIARRNINEETMPTIRATVIPPEVALSPPVKAPQRPSSRTFSRTPVAIA